MLRLCARRRRCAADPDAARVVPSEPSEPTPSAPIAGDAGRAVTVASVTDDATFLHLRRAWA